MKNNKGLAPLWIILGVVVVGGAVYALVARPVLKGFFERGDKPTADQFGDVIDSNVNTSDDVDHTGSKEHNPAKTYAVGDTVVKSETIYQAKVLNQDQKEFKLDAIQSVTFRWTPIVPKPQEPVTYRLKVWQLMQGQNGSQAMKTNQPIVAKDVVNVTEVTVSGIYTGPCKPPYLCDFVWNVDALVAPGASTGTSEATTSTVTETTMPTGTKGSGGAAH